MKSGKLNIQLLIKILKIDCGNVEHYLCIPKKIRWLPNDNNITNVGIKKLEANKE